MQKQIWNPYPAGALTGILLVLSVLMSGHFIGASALTLILFRFFEEKKL